MKNKTSYIILISIILLMLTPSLFASAKKEVQDETKQQTTTQEVVAKYNRIDAETAKAAFDSQKDITIIDVRTPSEFYSGHVPNSVNIPLSIVVDTVLEQYPLKDEKLYLYCRSGNRSSQAAKLLVEKGYTHVYDFGGINKWPYEVVK